jgi:DNA-binding IclR family transcriptional regulator
MSEKIVSVDRALDILLLMYNNGKEMGVSEIGKDLELPKSTVHRILTTLENKGFVHQNKENERYWLGIKLYAMGLLVGEKLSLGDLIKPYAKQLFDEFKEVINVSILDTDSSDGYKSIVILKEADTQKTLSVNHNVGTSSEAHVSSVGKSLLAFTEDLDIEKLKGLKQYTENTLTDVDEILEELAKVRQNGYCIDNEEQEIGLTCIGAPIIGKNGNAVAAMSISGPSARMKQKDFEHKVQRLKETVAEINRITKQLG